MLTDMGASVLHHEICKRTPTRIASFVDAVCVLTFATAMCATLGCSDLTGGQQLPAGTPSPSDLHTQAGALGQRDAALVALRDALGAYISDAGLLSDEFGDPATGQSPATLHSATVVNPLDERILPELSGGVNARLADPSYSGLQHARSTADQAAQALAAYAPNLSPALRGEMYAVQGYAEIMLADLFCSGVPLSTLDFDGDFTLHAGSPTQQVYAAALAKFDTAIALSADSARILAFAKLGKARTYVAMDSMTAAALVAAAVPNGFNYMLSVNFGTVFSYTTVSDREGGNGLPYRSGGDPRSAVVAGENTKIFPAKYSDGLTGLHYASFTVADWVEARLIEAEAKVRAHDSSWLTTLNALRTTCTDVATCPTPASVGTAGVEGLPPLSDPGSDSARISLVFTERAYWLFVTGHRQGDLRRLVRNYRRPEDKVYPTGAYLGPGTGFYGHDVTVPIPNTENTNPLFHGCLNRDA